MNLPNKLTVFRIVLTPFFVAALLLPQLPHHYLVAAILFGIASYTDHLDGMLARKNDLVTNFGKFLDPLADKILVISALVCFVKLDFADIWLVLLMIAREFMVTSIRLVAMDTGKVIVANNWGKAKTVSQIAAICVILVLQYVLGLAAMGVVPLIAAGGVDMHTLFGMVGDVCIFIATLFSMISGGIYLKENWDVIRQAN